MPGSYKLNSQTKSQSRREMLLTLMRKLGLAEDQDEGQETLEITNPAELEECRQEALLIAKGLTQHCEFCVITDSCLEDAINTFRILKHLDELDITFQRKEKELVQSEAKYMSPLGYVGSSVAEEESELRSIIYTTEFITETEMTRAAIEPLAGKYDLKEEDVEQEEFATVDDSTREDKNKSVEISEYQTSDSLEHFSVTEALEYQIIPTSTAVPSVTTKPWLGVHETDDKDDTCEEALVETRPVTEDVEEFDRKPVSIRTTASHIEYAEQNLDETISPVEHTTLKLGSTTKVIDQGSLETETHTLGREEESSMEDSKDEDVTTEEESAQPMQDTDDDGQNGVTAVHEGFRKEVSEGTAIRAEVRPLAATVPKKTVLRKENETLEETQLAKDLPLDSKVVIEVIEAEITEDTFKKEHAFILNELIRLRDVLQNAIHRFAKGAEDDVAPPGETISTEPEVLAAPQRMSPLGGVSENYERKLPPNGQEQLGAAAAESKQQLETCITKLSSVKQLLDECSSSDDFEKLGTIVGFPAGCCDMDDYMFHVHGFLNGIPAIVSLDQEDETPPSCRSSNDEERRAAIVFIEKLSMTIEKAMETVPLRRASCMEKFNEISLKPQSKYSLRTVRKFLSQSVEQLPQQDAPLLTGSPSVGIPYYPAVISLPHVNRDLRDELMQLGSDLLALAAIPASCCKQSATREPSDECVPYSVSLKSLPLDREDVDDIKERIEHSMRADTNSR